MSSTDTTPHTTSAWDELVFDNRFTDELPADPIEGPALRQVTGAVYSRVRPVTVPDPRIIGWSAEVAADLGLPADYGSDPDSAAVLTGNRILVGADPHAMNYGGHQFGNWAGQLGDGRAIALGEVVGADGRHHTLQLKGAGPTPYSRRADGLAVLRSSVREFLCSEAMHHLGVPTTRALSLALTGNQVMRDMFYDGNPAPEPGAVVCRVAPSFLRFGNYQILAARDDGELLRTLVDFTITHHFGHLGAPSPEVYGECFAEICRTTCAMVLDWMRVGFVHGVMNTDNMSIHGLTIDYGPYGWLDDFDPDWTPNTTDANGRRYRYGYQPQIAQWNLLQLANALVDLVGATEPLEAALHAYATDFADGYRRMMLAKLGLTADRGEEEADDALIGDLVEVLRLTETDMTIFHRRLADVPAETAADDGPAIVADAYYTPDTVGEEARTRTVEWLRAYGERCRLEKRGDAERAVAMNAVNPKYVLRNYLAQQAIDAATEGDFGEIATLLELLRRPYDDQPDQGIYAAKRPDWARTKPGCSMLSCSS
ncbi:MAG: YdiU family protein [Actinomycetota bacterium]